MIAARQIAMKEKAMANLRTDKMAVKMDTLEKQLQQATMAAGASMSRYDQTNTSKQGGEITSDPSKATLGKASEWAADRRVRGFTLAQSCLSLLSDAESKGVF
jgi:hypothetical protein